MPVAALWGVRAETRKPASRSRRHRTWPPWSPWQPRARLPGAVAGQLLRSPRVARTARRGRGRDGLEEPAALRFLPDAAEALIGVGELVQASRRLDPFEKRAAQKARSSFTAACICTVSGPDPEQRRGGFR